jgi:hypothetical protein
VGLQRKFLPSRATVSAPTPTTRTHVRESPRPVQNGSGNADRGSGCPGGYVATPPARPNDRRSPGPAPAGRRSRPGPASTSQPLDSIAGPSLSGPDRPRTTRTLAPLTIGASLDDRCNVGVVNQTWAGVADPVVVGERPSADRLVNRSFAIDFAMPKERRNKITKDSDADAMPKALPNNPVRRCRPISAQPIHSHQRPRLYRVGLYGARLLMRGPSCQ